MAATVITVANAQLIYGTFAEIDALDSGTSPAVAIGDVGFATDTYAEYTWKDVTSASPVGSAAVMVLTRQHNSAGAAHVDNERGPNGYANGGEAVTYSETAGTSASAITGNYVDVTCTTDAFISIAAATAATNGGYFCSAGLTYRFPITTTVSKLSAIRLTTSGTMYVHPVA